MGKYKKLLVIIFYVIVLLSSSAISKEVDTIFRQIQNNNTKKLSLSEDNYLKAALSPHSPIAILSDDDFISQGFPGNGTESEPYQMKNLDITTIQQVGIYVRNTTKYFQILNCFIMALEFGILIDEIAPYTATVENNTCVDHIYYGIYIIESNYVKVKNNKCHENQLGIAINTAHHLEILNNICQNNIEGISVLYSAFTSITNNILSLNRYGINAYYLENSFVEKNELIDSIYSGISLTYSQYSQIEQNYCTDGVFGIFTEMSHDISIIDNKCSNNNQDGIYSRDTNDTQIFNNYSARNNESGIRISICSNITVLSNTCVENKNSGIFTYYGEFTSLNPPEIIENLCRNNTIGMRIWETYHAIIRNNTVESNGQGILLVDSKNTEITDNILLKNKKYGVKIDTLLSTWNEIYGNYFICNNFEGTDTGFSQALDNSYNNRWYNYDTKNGNYWTDFNGEGEYQIDGNHNTTDPYPFVYNYDCCTDIPTEESSLNLLIFLLSFIGITAICRRRIKRKNF